MKHFYWQIVMAFIVLLIMVSAIHLFVVARCAKMYYQETNQLVNADVAAQISEHLQPKVRDGKLGENCMQKIADYQLAINPSIEVYILNSAGNILASTSDSSKRQKGDVPIKVLDSFITANASQSLGFTTNIDPISQSQKVFSAAPIMFEGNKEGYVYVVLAGEKYDSILDMLFNSYKVQVGIRVMSIVLITALLIASALIWYLTRNLNTIQNGVEAFENGELEKRIDLSSGSALSDLAASINKMEDTIWANIEELKNTEKLRRELIANVSHDLRTPLAVVQGYIETLQMKGDELSEAEKEKYLNIVLKGTKKLKRLISELFELSKLEAKQIKPNVEPFFLGELIQDASHRYQILAEEKGINIKTTLHTTPMVMADIALIERVVQNLLDNAIKFTPKGGTIEIVTETLEKGKGVTVKVSDTGVGITKEDMPYVFDRYQKKSQRKRKEGAGLGLAIVKKILELHDTAIQLNSQVNQGSTFSFHLPTAQ